MCLILTLRGVLQAKSSEWEILSLLVYPLHYSTDTKGHLVHICEMLAALSELQCLKLCE